MSESVLVQLLGTFAAALVLSAFIPQVIKSYKRKRMKDASILLMSFIAIGMSLWIVYGIMRQDIVIIGANIAGVTLNLLLVGMKLKYDSRMHKSG